MSWQISELVNEYSKPKFWLANRNKEVIARLSELDERASFNYNFVEVGELTGVLPLYLERGNKRIKNPHWESFKGKMLIKMLFMNIEFWFTIERVSKSDGDGEELSFTAYTYEHSLSAEKLYETELETAKATVNFEKVLEDSFWKLTFVDSKLSEKQRSFEFSTNTTVLDALYEMAESYGGILQFDTINETMGLFHEDTICYFDDFVINQRNYIESIEDERDSQNIVTRMYALGEDNMTFSTVSPSGQSYIDNFSYFMYPYQEDENGNTIQSSAYMMSDGLCHNLLQMQKARDKAQPLIEAKFKELKEYQLEVTPLENNVSDAQLQHDIVENRLDVLRTSKEYYYQNTRDTNLVETVRAGYYVLQARTISTNSGSITIKSDHGDLELDVTRNWTIQRLNIFNDDNFDADNDTVDLQVALKGHIEYMMIRVYKEDEEDDIFIDEDDDNTSTFSIGEPTTVNALASAYSLSFPSLSQQFFKTALNSYVEKVNREINGKTNLTVIPLITDTHYAADSARPEPRKSLYIRGLEHMKVHAELTKNTNSDLTVHMGDTIDGREKPANAKKELNTVMSVYSDVKTPKFVIRGNHDTNYLHYWNTGKSVISSYLKANMFVQGDESKAILSKYWTEDGIKGNSSDSTGLYAYKDLTSKKIRAIMLDSYDLNEVLDSSGKRIYSPKEYMGYQEAQLKWLVQTLNSTPIDYDVLIFSHVSVTRGVEPQVNEINFKGVQRILQAFHKRTKITYKYTHKHFGADVTADFTTPRQSLIIATVAGHSHVDSLEYDKAIDKTIPNLIRNNAFPMDSSNPRNLGAASETSMDTMIIDKDNRKITFLRFGMGEDIVVPYGTPVENTDDNDVVDDEYQEVDETEKDDDVVTSISLLDREADQYLSDEEFLLKYNIKYHEDQLNYHKAVLAYKNADIELVNQELLEIKSTLREDLFLTNNQIKEKKKYIFVDYFIDENHIDAQEMYDDTKKKLEELNVPSINMTIDIFNFLNSVEHTRNWEKLKIGKKIRVKHGDLDIYSEAVISAIDFNFESEDISLTITGTKDINDPDKEIVKILSDLSSVSSSLSLKKKLYDDASNKANAAKEYMENNLNAALQRIHAGVNETVELSNRGIVIKSIDYPMDVIMMNSGVIGLSDNGGQTLRTAITAKGITAEEIVGKILISQKAHIEDDDGIVSIKGDKITISTPNPDSEDRVVLGQYEEGKYGLKIDNGALEIVNGLKPEHIIPALSGAAYTIQLVSMQGYDFAYEDEEKELICKVYDGNGYDITDVISQNAFKWEKVYNENRDHDLTWENGNVGVGNKVAVDLDCALATIKCTVKGIRINEEKPDTTVIYFGVAETTFSKSEYEGNLNDKAVRGDLNLTAPLPTSIKMDSTGITAYTTSSSVAYARLDYRGLFVQNGAIDIRSHEADNRGVILNKNGLKGYRSNGNLSFNLSTDGYLTLDGGYLSITNGLQRSHLDSSMVYKWDTAESNSKSYTDEKEGVLRAYAEANDKAQEERLRDALNLEADLPTNLLLNGNGITAYTTGDTSKFARLDYRGLYIQGGALDIRTGSGSSSQGVILNSSGLKGYDSEGNLTFSLGADGKASFFVGKSDNYTRIVNNYLETYGTYSRSWGQHTGNFDIYTRIQEGRLRIRNETYKRSLYFSDFGISTFDDGTSYEQSSGIIEFFSSRFNETRNGLTLYSSGNIGFETVRSNAIYLNSNGGNVVVGDTASSPSGKLFTEDLRATGYTIVSDIAVNNIADFKYYLNCTGDAYFKKGISADSRSYFAHANFGIFSTSGNWLLSDNDSVKIGGSSGIINLTGNLTCLKVVETSKRELKKNIKTYEGSGLDIVNSMQIKEYQYLDDVENVDMPYIGLILDEAPVEVADTKGEGVLVAQGTWINSKAIQELHEELLEEKQKNIEMKETLDTLMLEFQKIKDVL